ncbi:MAG: hypothetical protein ABFC73_11765 [Clostridiaceae bacterium]
MQKKSLLVIITLLLLIVPAVSLAEAESVGSNDLIDRAKDYDGQAVVYEGEVVGDILYRGDYAWLAVSDGANTIGCYVTKAQAEQISFVGGYGKRGDTVRVEGVFHRACAEHGGDLDLHADTVKIITVGGLVNTPQSRLVTVLAAVLPLPAAALLFLVWKRRGTHKQSQKSLTVPLEK